MPFPQFHVTKLLILIILSLALICSTLSSSIIPSNEAFLFDALQPTPEDTLLFTQSTQLPPHSVLDTTTNLISSADRAWNATLFLYCGRTFYLDLQQICSDLVTYPMETSPIFSIRHNNENKLREHYPLMYFVRDHGEALLTFFERSTFVSIKMNAPLTPSDHSICYQWNPADPSTADVCDPAILGPSLCTFLQRWCAIRLASLAYEHRLYLHYNLIIRLPAIWLQVHHLFPHFDELGD